MANNLSELDPEADVDPLTDTKTVAQQSTPDEDIIPLQGAETAYDTLTGAAHPAVTDPGKGNGNPNG